MSDTGSVLASDPLANFDYFSALLEPERNNCHPVKREVEVNPLGNIKCIVYKGVKIRGAILREGDCFAYSEDEQVNIICFLSLLFLSH